MVEIKLGRTQELRVHDVLEYKFEDLMQEFVSEEEAGAGEEKQRTLIWAQGVVMWIAYIQRPTSQIVDDEVNGILHFQRVTYAIKKKFEKRLVRGNVTVYLLDQNEIPLYRDLAKKLKWLSQWKKGIRYVPESYDGETTIAGDPVFVKNLETIEKEIGSTNNEEYEFITAGYNLGLPVRLTADLLKERRNNGPVAESEPVTESEIKKPSIRNAGSGTDEKLRN